MGGSSLAPEVLATTFGNQDDYPELLVLDTTVPAAITTVENKIDLQQTVFIVASKSGSTIETASLFEYFYDKTVTELGETEAGAHFILITDPESPLIEIGKKRQVNDIFENPPDIGGRYSALSYFGLVPAALLGLDLNKLYKSAEQLLENIEDVVPSQCNPALILGVIMGYLAQNGRDKLSLITSPQIASFGNWVEQLVAESTGKEGVGILPVVGATVGLPHDYDDDRYFVYLRLDNEDNELDAKVNKLLKLDIQHTQSGYEIRMTSVVNSYGGNLQHSVRWSNAGYQSI